jgi:hypothetical protein
MWAHQGSNLGPPDYELVVFVLTNLTNPYQNRLKPHF